MKLKAILDIIAGRPLLRRKDLAQRFNVTERTIDRWHTDRHLPPAVYLPGCPLPLWRPFEVDAFETKSAKRRARG